jgi:hypothetical protein
MLLYNVVRFSADKNRLARDTKHLHAIRNIYGLSLQDNASKGRGNQHLFIVPEKSTNGLHHESVVTLNRAQGLINLFYEASTGMVCREATQSINKKWNNEVQETKRILDTGRRFGERKVEKFLYSSHGGLLSEDATKTSELFYKGTNGREDDTSWARAVRKHEKAIVRLAMLSRE